MVNTRGERFVDETRYPGGVGKGMLDLPDKRAWIIFDQRIYQPELIFHARVAMDLKQLQQSWQQASSRFEHLELVPVHANPNAISEFLQDCGTIVPVTVASFCFHADLLHEAH